MISKINSLLTKKPILFGGTLFLLLSLIFNTVEILLFKSVHIHDVIHVFPTVLIYEPILNALAGLVRNQIYYLPIACMVDFVIGLLLSLVFNYFNYTKNHFFQSQMIAFIIYWVIVTFQWIPIL